MQTLEEHLLNPPTVAGWDGFIAEGGAKNVARRDGMGTTVLSAVTTIGEIPDAYFQAVGSGTGAIAIFLAGHAGRVTGLEIVEGAVADARRQATRPLALDGVSRTGYTTTCDCPGRQGACNMKTKTRTSGAPAALTAPCQRTRPSR